MQTATRTLLNRMGQFEYKGCRVEIFTGKKGLQWTWSFVVNGTKSKGNARDFCKTSALAADAARAEACRFIDAEF
ncbi:MAG: hypothetical protein ABWY05_12415 [Noviherbaspirillum sp.]